MSLNEKIVVITGGSMGIGEAVGRVFHAEGATVVLTSRELMRAQEAAGRLGGGNRLVAMALDVRDRAQIRATVADVLARFGRIDVWINNAGHALGDSVAAMNMDVCREIFDTNLFGAIDCLQAVVPIMKNQGGGAIINISSVAGHITVPYMAAYGATKSALNAISRAARMELARFGIQVNNVCPGFVRTNFARRAVQGRERPHIGGAVRSGISAERVARAVLRGYLANRREVVLPWWYHIVIPMYQLMPRLVEFGIKHMLRPTDQVLAETETARERT